MYVHTYITSSSLPWPPLQSSQQEPELQPTFSGSSDRWQAAGHRHSDHDHLIHHNNATYTYVHANEACAFVLQECRKWLLKCMLESSIHT